MVTDCCLAGAVLPVICLFCLSSSPFVFQFLFFHYFLPKARKACHSVRDGVVQIAFQWHRQASARETLFYFQSTVSVWEKQGLEFSGFVRTRSFSFWSVRSHTPSLGAKAPLRWNHRVSGDFQLRQDLAQAALASLVRGPAKQLVNWSWILLFSRAFWSLCA